MVAKMLTCGRSCTANKIFKMCQVPLVRVTFVSRASFLKVMIGDPLRATTAEGRCNLSDDALRVGIPLDYMDVCRCMF